MKKKSLLILGGIVGVLGVSYIGISLYFNSHYLLNTTIEGIACGGKNANYIIKENEKRISNYLLNIKDRNNNSFPLVGSDISYEYVSNGEEEDILKKQNPFTWPLSFFKKYSYSLKKSVTYNKDTLLGFINGLEIFSTDYIKAPENAYIKIGDGNYEVVDDIPGNTPIYDEIESEIITALDDESDEVVLSDSCYKKADILSDDERIKNAMNKIDSYANSTIHYLIDNVDENLSKEKIIDMIQLTDNFDVSIDETKIDDYVQYLASTYNTYGDVRKFKTSSGDTVKIGGGDYGWVISKTGETEQIKKDLEGGKAVSREPVYEQTALQSGLDDIGDTYIEIDYTKQHLWYYVEGKLKMETDIVSGNLSTQNGSVDGVYTISNKERDRTLSGENYDTDVKFFMPFAYNIGIHDASWRHGVFGGTLYKTSGSHGCINVPPDFAKKLFNSVDNGTPVIAYYREKVKLTNTAAQISNAYSYVKEDE